MICKRIFDLSISIVGLFLLLPALLIIALAIIILMPDGPVLFKQSRVGKEGKHFIMYKFRTMVKNQDNNFISIAGEKRITPLGAILRKYKLDELPELWNVIKGDMSLVGPRPDVPGYADQLTDDARILLSVKPGITSPASLKYINEEELLAVINNPRKYNDDVIWPDKVRININYINNWSFWLDLKIIFYTILGRKLKDSWAQ